MANPSAKPENFQSFYSVSYSKVEPDEVAVNVQSPKYSIGVEWNRKPDEIYKFGDNIGWMDLVRREIGRGVKNTSDVCVFNQYEQNWHTFRDKPKVLNGTVLVALDFLTIV